MYGGVVRDNPPLFESERASSPTSVFSSRTHAAKPPVIGRSVRRRPPSASAGPPHPARPVPPPHPVYAASADCAFKFAPHCARCGDLGAHIFPRIPAGRPWNGVSAPATIFRSGCARAGMSAFQCPRVRFRYSQPTWSLCGQRSTYWASHIAQGLAACCQLSSPFYCTRRVRPEPAIACTACLVTRPPIASTAALALQHALVRPTAVFIAVRQARLKLHAALPDKRPIGKEVSGVSSVYAPSQMQVGPWPAPSY